MAEQISILHMEVNFEFTERWNVISLFYVLMVLRESLDQLSVSAPIGTVENKRIVASYGFIYTPECVTGVFLCLIKE